MKRFIVAAALAAALLAPATLAPPAADASVSVGGYTRRDGTVVAPHHRSDPDSSISNNWSSAGNYNPYTGEQGTRSPYPSSSLYPSYGSRSYYP